MDGPVVFGEAGVFLREELVLQLPQYPVKRASFSSFTKLDLPRTQHFLLSLNGIAQNCRKTIQSHYAVVQRSQFCYSVIEVLKFLLVLEIRCGFSEACKNVPFVRVWRMLGKKNDVEKEPPRRCVSEEPFRVLDCFNQSRNNRRYLDHIRKHEQSTNGQLRLCPLLCCVAYYYLRTGCERADRTRAVAKVRARFSFLLRRFDT